MDFDLVRSCYHPDAIDRHGAYEGDIEGFIKWAAELLPMFESTMHFTGNQYVQVNGDVGYAEHYARAFHRTRPNGDKPATDYVVNVRYIDRMERRNGEWRIADRMIAFELERTDPTEWTDAAAEIRLSLASGQAGPVVQIRNCLISISLLAASFAWEVASRRR